MVPLAPVFLDRPIAHRALHGPGRPENSRAAVRAAVAAGYGVEIDIQMSKDHHAMVFHDYDMKRLTGHRGPIQQRTVPELADMPLLGGHEGVPTLTEVLRDVNGAVPLLIEIKDQDGRMGPKVGTLERAVAAALDGYGGPVAVMSFNPHTMAELARLLPGIPRGLTTCAFKALEYPTLPATVRSHLRAMPGLAEAGASFISHDHKDLDMPEVAAQKARGLHVLCWTIRSPADEAKARRIADNVTFEGYAA
ncbi:glycerophosphodiester phosphodiesterase family protein [Maliponia aquimaris]|uniref:Cytoplasmic glycerophosphodiester phosphodiesterase n=1 Tax=Maliponia aquimaris TaxID=1673631 RepID=A0A238KCY2_9RHOB|nr:glycerophosphodiester phosphodiesterase family protein [Maliponia aquimaris]SMX40669.1 cytoplasmic glycerophosphodiester phosphodiesterase [Maliponia aquimaris]